MNICVIIGMLMVLISVITCESLLADDSDVQSKLDALESAHKAGVLTDEEYARKREELLGKGTTSTENLALYRDAQGNFEFQYPHNWTHQAIPQRQGVTLKHGNADISIMLFPGSGSDQKLLEFALEQTRGQWRNLGKTSRGQRRAGGRSAPMLEVTGVNAQGVQSHLQMVAFTVSGAGYVFLLSAPENEFAGAKPVLGTILDSFRVISSLPIRKKGNIYRHPIGFTFWYPENWKIQETPSGVQLVPPDLESGQYGPTEGYIVFAQSAQGLTRPDDPRIIQYLEMQVASIAPYLRRTGGLESVKAGTELGILITWEGQNPVGMQMRAYVFAALIKGYGVALAGLGERDRIEGRKSILKEIFSSFGLGEGEKDPRLIGTWRSESYYSSRTSSDSFNTTSIRYMVFQPDGSFSSGGRFLASTQNDYPSGGTSSSSTVDTGSPAGERGRWGTGSNRLYLMWDDGSYAEYGYHIEGVPGDRKMLLNPVNGKNELWEEIR